MRLILLQKSKVSDLRIFRETTEREAIADSYNLNRVTEVACEFNVRRRGPHIFTRKPHRQPLEFLIISAKPLLQQYPPNSGQEADIAATSDSGMSYAVTVSAQQAAMDLPETPEQNGTESSPTMGGVGLFWKKVKQNQNRILRLVPVEGIEPPLLAEHDFESCASTSSATRACAPSIYSAGACGKKKILPPTVGLLPP